MRILLFTGKGGVGKTTAAAATALRCAELGYETLVISTDPAHSLSDSLDVRLEPEPTQVADHLYAQELDVYYSMKKYWGNMRELLLTVFKWQGVNKIVAEELSALPGMEEGSAFLWLEQHYRSKAYDVLIVDSAPTGETLTFLNLPQVTQWWLKKSIPGQKAMIQGVGGMLRMVTGVPIDKGYEEMDSLFEKLGKIQAIFADPNITSMRLVMNPERMVIQEAKRAYAFLQMYGYAVDSVLVNRVLPESLENSFFQSYVANQSEYLDEIENSFSPLPIFKAPHLGKEVFGLERLKAIAEHLYGNEDPTQVYHNEKPYQLNERGSKFELEISLPFVEIDDVNVTQYQDQLVIDVKNKRKHVYLPKFLAYYRVKRYVIASKKLKVTFIKK